MPERKVWNEKMETISRGEMEKVRLEKLKRQLKYCCQNSDFFKRKFAEAGFEPEDIVTWDDFRKIPVLMTKEDERVGQEESIERFGHPFGMQLCVPPEKIIVAHTTSGTTGTPTFSHSYTKSDLDRWNESACRALWLNGIRPGDRVLYYFPLSGAGVTSAGWIIDAINYAGVLTIDAGTELPLERALMLARMASANALMSSPSLAEMIIEKCKEATGIEPRELGFKKLSLSGEPGIAIPAIRNRIEEAFGGRWSDWIAPNGEGCCASCETKEYQGLHEVTPELSICCEDLVNPMTKKPVEVKDGAIGEPLITSLDREGRPYVKYALGDIVQVFTKPCQCDYPGPGYRKMVLGRVDDMLIIEDVYVLPMAIKETLTSFEPRLTGAMRIVLTEPPPKVAPPLKIKVEHQPGIEKLQLEELGKETRKRIQEVHKISSDIELVPSGTLELVGWKSPMIEKRY